MLVAFTEAVEGARRTHEGAGDQGEPQHRGASYATREYSGHHRTAQTSLCPTTIEPSKELSFL
jgi:hypothetical protein